MYALPLWSPWLEQDIQMPEKVQKKAVGMVPGLGGKIMKKNAENFMKIYTFQSKNQVNYLSHQLYMELLSNQSSIGDVPIEDNKIMSQP